jgi:CheY-like chemotaxis protein
MRLEIAQPEAAFPAVASDGGPEQFPYDVNGLVSNGVSAARNGDRAFARTLLTKATEVDPDHEEAWMWLASISEYPEELLAFLDRVLDINPANERAIEWRAATLTMMARTLAERATAAREQGNDQLAAECLEQAFDHDAECLEAWRLKAAMATVENDRLACLERIVEIDPANEEVRSAIAEIVRTRSDAAFEAVKAAAVAGKRKKAMELVDEFLRSVPDNAEAWILRSHLALDLEDKLSSLEEALRIDPDNPTARSGYDFLRATLAPKSSPPAETAQPEPDVSIADLGSEPVDLFASREAEPFECVDVFETVEPFEPVAPLEPSEPAEAPAAFEPADAPEPPVPYMEETPFDSFADEAASTPAGFDSGSHVDVPVPDPSSVEAPPDVHAESFEDAPAGAACPFCHTVNRAQAFDCSSCSAVLSLADIESLLANERADGEVIQEAVTQLEAEWNLREFSPAELVTLALGHFNLHNFGPGLQYLREAALLDPNDVILSGQVNAIAIRLDELERQAEAHEGLPRGKTILVVDDSATVRKLISGKLEKSGHKVICASDGIEALECLAIGLPDLVLLDITMPRMDGYEVCKQIRANPAAHDLPVVMISGRDGFFDKVRGRMAGSTGYVTKPFGPETLMKALETYLRPDVQ